MLRVGSGTRRLLFLAPTVPDRGGNGLAMRTGLMLDACARHFDVDLAVIPLATIATQLSDFARARSSRAVMVPLGAPDTHFGLLAMLRDPRERVAAFRRYGRPTICARLTAEVEARVKAFAGDADYAAVHVSRLYLAELAGRLTSRCDRSPRRILDCDEDDAAVQRSLAALSLRRGQDGEAQWARAEAEAFEGMAATWLPRFDLVLAASAAEANMVRARARDGRVAVVPNVAPDVMAPPLRKPGTGPVRNIVFVGTMDYAPNIDAVLWFVSRLWPRLRAAVPFRLRLTIVGRDPPREIARLAGRAGIVVTAAVGDVAPFYRTADLAILPLRAGGGTRIKLLEAAVYRVPVVSTRFGAQGLGFRSGHDVLLADSEPEFVRACVRLLTDGPLAATLAERASRRIRRDHTPDRWARFVGQAVAGAADVKVPD